MAAPMILPTVLNSESVRPVANPPDVRITLSFLPGFGITNAKAFQNRFESDRAGRPLLQWSPVLHKLI